MKFGNIQLAKYLRRISRILQTWADRIDPRCQGCGKAIPYTPEMRFCSETCAMIAFYQLPDEGLERRGEQ